jgi:dihydropteroate synthase
MKKSSVQIMGILNITPNSFSDGGEFLSLDEAYRHACEMIDDGAEIIDIGGESTRPGSQGISIEEEWRRIEPILSKLVQHPAAPLISIDTSKPTIMQRAIDSGAHIINDVKGAAHDPELLRQLARGGAHYIAMHMHQDPSTMQNEPLTAPLALREVEHFYTSKHRFLLECGFDEQKIWLDPGIGFGKADAANIQLLAHALEANKKWNIAIGISRKSFIGRLFDIPQPKERDAVCKSLELGLMLGGIRMIRTHDVRGLNKLRQMLA